MGGNHVVLPKRGEIYYVSFDPTIGVEIKKTRPALIIQNDIGNMHSPATIVAAITSTEREAYPHEVSLNAGEGGLPKDSIILLNQIRTIDKKRLGRKLGTISPDALKKVDRAIAISLGLIKI
jgi:mRNA interferase MazF